MHYLEIVVFPMVCEIMFIYDISEHFYHRRYQYLFLA